MPTLYYKTLKNSNTGNKLQALIDKGNEVEKQINSYMDELGAGRKYLVNGRYIFHTGICGILFSEIPDMKVWKNFQGFENYYKPRLSSKLGKEIRTKLDSFDLIDRDEIGKTFGFDSFLSDPGFQNRKESDFFGIGMDSNWFFNMPEEFTEITFTEYQKL